MDMNSLTLNFNEYHLAGFEIAERLGLDTDKVLKYISPQFDRWQIQEICKGIRDGLDVSVYADPVNSDYKMYIMRHGMKKGIDVSKYSKFEANQIRQICNSILLGENLEYLDNVPDLTGFDKNQIKEITKGLFDKVDITQYAKKEYGYRFMKQIRKALKAGIDIENIDGLSIEKIKMLRIAYKSGVDISKYILDFNCDQLEEIYKGILFNLDVSIFADPKLNYFKMKQIRKGLLIGINIMKYIDSSYDRFQMGQIRKSLSVGIDITPYVTNEYNSDQMEQIKLALLDGIEIDTNVFNYNMSWETMRDLRFKITGKEKFSLTEI